MIYEFEWFSLSKATPADCTTKSFTTLVNYHNKLECLSFPITSPQYLIFAGKAGATLCGALRFRLPGMLANSRLGGSDKTLAYHGMVVIMTNRSFHGSGPCSQAYTGKAQAYLLSTLHTLFGVVSLTPNIRLEQCFT
jgi:hypothetical protein